MIRGHLGVLLEIGVRAEHVVLLLKVVVHELCRIQTEDYEERTERLFLLLVILFLCALAQAQTG